MKTECGVIVLALLTVIQTALLGTTLYINTHTEPVQLEKKVIIERYYVQTIQQFPEDVFEEEEEILEIVEEDILSTLVLSQKLGRVQGPQEEETYYNLSMDNVVENMRDKGYAEIDYPYYVREDGVKMLGDFIIVATDLDKYPRGTVVQTSLGQGLVCDKCETPDTIDIAVEW